MRSAAQRGSVLLPAAVFVFTISLLVAGGALYYTRFRGEAKTVSDETMVGTPLVALEADFVADAFREDEQRELRERLYMPLREYYATQSERLVSVAVSPSEDVEHTTEVVVRVQSGDGSRDHVFFYDRTGEERNGEFPVWELSLYDNQ